MSTFPQLPSLGVLERLLPCCQRGNHDRTQLVGIDMLNLVIFIIAHPDAHTDDLAVFIYDEGDALYDQTTISKRLKELQITKREGLESGEPI